MSTKTMPVAHDVRTEEGWRAAMRDEVNRIGAIACDEEMRLHIVQVFCCEDPMTGARWGKPRTVLMIGHHHGDNDEEVESSKNDFANSVLTMALAGDAIATTSAAEAWMSCVPANPDGSMPTDRPQPRNDPNRKEGLFVVCNHREFANAFWRSFIEHKDGKRTLSEWRCEGSALAGRMSFLPPPQVYQHKKKAKELCRLILEHQIKVQKSLLRAEF